MTQPHTHGGPYAQASARYWEHGWRGLLPLPPRAKKAPPTGWTGASGAWPSRADVAAWADGPDGDGNIGLRLPRTIIGLDVDNYAGKIGGLTLEQAVRRFGPLPATWRSTSRDDGVSGIRLYRVPEGLAWPGELGPGTEIIQHRHRYVVAWPSVHPEGRVYRWITPDGATAATAVPAADDLPDLPDAWIAGLTQGQLEADVPKADIDDMEAVAWLVKHGAGAPCGLMQLEVDRYLADRFADHSSRHDAAKDATARLTHLAAEGHRGAHTAIEAIRIAFIAATEQDPTRARDAGEWKRLLTGAIRIAAVDTQGHDPVDDPCDAPTVLELPPPAAAEPPPAPPAVVDLPGDGVPPVTVLELPAAAVDLSILDDTTTDPAQTIRSAQERAVEAEVNIQRIRREAKRVLDVEEATAAFREPPSRFTLVEELAIPDEPVTYAVEEILPTGGNVLLTAQFKAGKTTLVNHLTRCLADGQPFLGKLNVSEPNGRVALFNYEVDERQYRRWLREVGIGAEPLVSVLNLRGYRLPLVNRHVEDWVVRWLSEHDIAVWVVDPFARAYVGSGTSENDNTEVGRFLDTLDVIKERAGVSELILPTHTGREVFEAGQERARGATRLDDWADVRWMLTKDEDDVRYFSATGRDVDFAESALYFDEAARAPRIAGASRAKESHRKLQDAIVSVVTGNPGISARQMRIAVRQIVGKVTNTDVDDAVALAEMHHLVRVVDGPNRSKMHYADGPTPLVYKPGEQ